MSFSSAIPPSLYFLSKLSTLSLQRDQEKLALVEELQERTELLDHLESILSATLDCFPEELVEFLKNHSNVQNLAEFAAELDIDPLGDTRTALLDAACEKLEKYWHLEKQLEEERNKMYQLEQLLNDFEAIERDFHAILHDFSFAPPKSDSQAKLDRERQYLNQLETALDQINSSVPSVNVTHEEIVELSKKVASLEAQVQEDQMQLDSYQKLPQDPILARIVLDEAKQKLQRLDAEKEDMLKSIKLV